MHTSSKFGICLAVLKGCYETARYTNHLAAPKQKKKKSFKSSEKIKVLQSSANLMIQTL